jgi:5'-methylthioadenosine phosphorylase
METRPVLGVIGGSGLYSIEGLEEVEEHAAETPFGPPSSPIVMGTLNGRRVAFLARHGIGHNLSPSDVNYRANLYALKMLGVERVISVSACGSLREDYAPGDVVVPDQLFDHTHRRMRSFFGDGIVGHVSVADPFCPDLSSHLAESVVAAGGTAHRGGASITIEGPRFSTRAESHTYRAWGMAIIGMTTSPEAFLAREAELCYAVMAHVTDYDVWHVSEQPVTVERVVQILKANTSLAQKALAELLDRLPATRPCECAHALRNAILTRRDRIPVETLQRLSLLVGRYIT